MNIIFDLSGTVFGSSDRSLRPGMKEAIQALRESGNTVEFWTSDPSESFDELLRSEGIEGRVFSKWEPLPFVPDICVDDEPHGWMPGHHYKVPKHVSKQYPGSSILVAELIYISEKMNFFWD